VEGAGTTRMRTSRLIPALGLMGFLLFGMRDGAVGVAWPSIRASFRQPLSALGLLVLASLGGYLVTSALSGRVGRLLPVGRQLVMASVSASAGVAVFALSTDWLLLVGASSLLGAANGIVDVNVNAHLAKHHRVGTMNLVHAGWGLGTTLGPLVVTASLALNGSWRPAYLLLLAFELVLLAGFVSTRKLWDATPARRASAAVITPTARRASKVALSATLVLFFVYAGLELGTGQWAYTFLVYGHAVGTTPAGLAVAVYWGALTGGRVVASVLGDRLRPITLLDICLGVTLAGCLLVLWYPSAPAAAAGLAVTGLGLGPVFPTLVSLTPARVGTVRTSAVMGYQLSAAALGGSLMSAVIGVALQHFGARALGSIVVAGAGVLIMVRSMTRRLEAA
jgi:fucose permease